MRTKLNGILTLFLAFVVQATFAQKTITGTVSDDMGPIPGASVLVKDTTNGTVTDFNGHYTISANTGDVLVFSMAGNSTEKTVGSSNVIDAVIGVEVLDDVTIVGQRGIKTKARDVAYANQALKGEDLGIGKDNNLKTALSGKIAGVQVAAQSGAKLGSAGKVYLRGAISALGRSEALYIVDGIETSADNVDMDDVDSINVLKGPAAVGLYGLRGADGVIVITTKAGKKGKVSVDVYNNTTFDTVSGLMDYQNDYGQGGNWASATDWATFDYASGTDSTQGHFSTRFNIGGLPYLPEWQIFDGKRYIANNQVDESWGPKFDGQDYIPWYSWWKGTAENPNPYFGKTEKYSAQPDNIKDFFSTGVTSKTGFAISGGNELGAGRIAYSRTDQSGILPNSKLSKDNVSAKFNLHINEKLNVGMTGVFSKRYRKGVFSDTYGTGTSANFNQWFGRNLDMNKMRELENLKNEAGMSASWNWWGPNDYMIGRTFRSAPYQDFVGNMVKPVFWFNPFFLINRDSREYKTNRFAGSFNTKYQANDHIALGLDVSTDTYTYKYSRKVPYELQYSAAYHLANDDFVNSLNTFERKLNAVEFVPSIQANYDLNDDVNLDVYLGYSSKTYDRESIRMRMSVKYVDPTGAGATYGLVIPDLFLFSNSRERVVPKYDGAHYKNKNLFSRMKIDYKKYLILTADISNVWDSRYDIIGADNKNSFMYGSVGASFVFTDLMENKGFINRGKLRANYGAVGTDTKAYKLNPSNSFDDLYDQTYSYNSNPLMYSASTAPNKKVSPATSKAMEGGFDLSMFNSKVKFSATYFNEHRIDEILNTTVSSTSGVSEALVNAGDVLRKGLEVELGLKALDKKDFKWNVAVNWSKVNSTVIRLADGQDSQLIGEYRLDHQSSFNVIYFRNVAGQQWGQLVGNAIKRDAAGNPVLIGGLYDFEADHNFGSVLPDFNGGIVNTFNYKGITLSGTVAFQKGGKFFSLSDWWGTQSGLTSNTVGNNDLGNPQRDAVADGGGVHVTGVDAAGAPVDTYVDASRYYHQFFDQKIAEGFVHDASYIKLSDLSLSYKIPANVLGKALKGASVGVIARNVALLSVSKDNTNKLDPSEMTYGWGEDAGLPRTRSIGFNVKLTF